MELTAVCWLKRLRMFVLAADNYQLVVLLIVLSILVTAVVDVAPFARIAALILFGGTLLYALHTAGVAPRLHRVASILLVGLFFAFLFRFTASVGLGPFFASTDRASDADYLYFSFSTLATLGYGDLVARTNLGRMLAVTEALFGQMYLVTVVALLVSNFGRHWSAGNR
jgi:hypothetical protein